MPNRRSLARRISPHGSPVFWTAAALLIVSLYSCAAKLSARAPWIPSDGGSWAKELAALRALPLQREIVFSAPLPREAPLPAPFSSRVAEYLSLPLRHVESAYKSVGVLSYRSDLKDALAEYSRLENLIRYDAAKSAVILARDAAGIGVALEKSAPRAAREAPAVIGLVKALQEQNFNWSAMAASAPSEDRRSAFQALSLGDAMLTVMVRASGKPDSRLSPADIALAHAVAAQVETLASSLPDFFRHKLSFPYRDGAPFAYWAYSALGWDGVNALYALPPASSSEILHPEKYFLRRGESLRIFPAGLFRLMGAAPILEQSFGESTIKMMLASEHGPKPAAVAAAPWRGDRLFSFQSAGESVTAWFTTWESAEQARQFHRLYQPALATRQRLRFQTAGEYDLQSAHAHTSDRGAFLLQAKGATVLLLNVVPPVRLRDIQQEVWRGLDIAPEPKIRSLDSARATAYESASKK